MKKRRGPTPKIEWTPFVESVPYVKGVPRPDHLRPGEKLYGNSKYVVHVSPVEGDLGMAGPVHLSIHHRDRRPLRDWRDFQRIKSEIMGPEREAVELYPAESRKVDTSNEYHLWVFPDGELLTLGFTTGGVMEPGEEPSDADIAKHAAVMGIEPETLRGDLTNARQRKGARR